MMEDKFMENPSIFESNALLALSDKEFGQIRELVYNSFGINLTEQKKSLVVGRLNKLIKQHGFSTFQNYIDYIKSDKTGKSLTILVDKISTNHTYFNREKDHFEYFSNTALPQWIDHLSKSGKKRFNLWIAGCSSGEESYMIAMLIKEYLGNNFKNWDIGLLATDISIGALETAINASYSKTNVDHMPANLKSKYFNKSSSGEYTVVDDIKKMVTYKKLNLIQQNFPFKSSFHMIFCRNVMIYFDKPTRDGLVTRFHKFLDPGGYLFIGHSETLGRDSKIYNYICPATYQKATS
jgi:chemotaxis protein methyltransferase CheR